MNLARQVRQDRRGARLSTDNRFRWAGLPQYDSFSSMLDIYEKRVAAYGRSYDQFWAKTSGGTDGALGTTKPVIEHLLDVSAVAFELVTDRQALSRRFAQASGIRSEQLPSLCAYLAALHDIGKLSRTFQSKAPNFWPTEILGHRPEDGVGGINHWRCTAVLLSNEPCNAVLSELLPGVGADDMKPLIAAIAGHHGVPPGGEDMPLNIYAHEKEISKTCVEAAEQACHDLRDVCGAVPQPDVSGETLARLSFLINGLVTVSDWIGSDTEYFPVSPAQAPAVDLAAYWSHARDRAKQAICDKGMTCGLPAPEPSYRGLDLACANSPRPMQAETAQCQLGDGPQLLFIEDTTGSGKTEAAVLLAARLMAAGRGEGIYFALPTMATANAMHARMLSAYTKLFTPNSKPSLVLAHGKAILASQIAKLKELNGTGISVDGEPETAQFCARWIADTRKLALYADIGVGTIDQAFLAVLQKKHLTLRQFALANRVLIVDEAHSFDAYMGEELKTLLQLHAMHGGSAIILSATLPKGVREGLCEAFRKGLPKRKWPSELPAKQGPGRAKQRPPDIGKSGRPSSNAYPLLTQASADAIIETPVAFDHRLARSVGIERCESRADAMTVAINAAQKDACVAIICNAVDEAIDVYRALRRDHDSGKVDLFHARFAMGDRMDIERRVLERFGKSSAPKQRRGQILVATQVIEQSLDLDFDLMITDLAPVDLLIQRAGRLWRHMEARPRQSRPLDAPRLLVVSPDPATVTDAKWLEPALGKAAFVYGHAGVMWRSARQVFDAGKLTVPDDLRPMVEAVYGQDAMAVPDCLIAAADRGDGEVYGGRSIAQLNVIDPALGYFGLQRLNADENVGTRLGEETVTIRLARFEIDRLVPWYALPGADQRLCLELSELTLRKKIWMRAGAEIDQQSEALRLFRKDWPDYEQTMPVMVIETNPMSDFSGPLYDQYFGFHLNS
jgi:CRISPR-associated endonuclease/helicase Cas3